MNIHGLLYIRRVLALGVTLSLVQFKTAYARSWLGYVWYLLNPILLFLIILFVRQKGGVFSSDIAQYPLYLLIGIILFQFLIRTTSAGLISIKNNKNLIKNMKVPLEAFVVSKVLAFIYTHVFDFLLLAIIVIMLGGHEIGLIMYPFIFLAFACFIFGIVLFLAPLGVYVVDTVSVWGFVGNILFFITPIFYVVVEGSILEQFNMFNPLFVYITLARDALLFGVLSQGSVVISALLLSSITPILGWMFFSRTKIKLVEYM